MRSETNYSVEPELAVRLHQLWEASARGRSGDQSTSARLTSGRIYSRTELAELFGITDATIRTGVFRPRGYTSIWLFITEKKSPDRTQYRDKLEGDELSWDGQTSGRTDRLVANHEQEGLELLVFYRERKDQYPDYGFRYEGPFRYVSHRGQKPAHFRLRRVDAGPRGGSLLGAEAERAFTDAVADQRVRARGQGFKVTPAARRAVEEHAMILAAAHFRARGYVVEDVSKTNPFDLLCRRAEEELRVEVKGTQTTGEEIILTAGEVKHAREQGLRMVLFVVQGVRVTEGPAPMASGGTPRVLLPWDIGQGNLTPLAYSYELPERALE